jgi:histidinol-phosphate aminotransferase
MSTNHLARADIQALVPYLSARRIGGSGDVWLNANESPDSSRFELDDSELNRYPEFQPAELIEAYAAYAGVASAQVLASRGADEGIEVLVRTFCEPGRDSIVINPPTYGMYAISAETCGVEIKTQALLEDFSPDYAALAKSDAKIIFLCAPNNPTGNLVDRVQLVALLNAQKDKALVVVDEAYIEFCIESSVVDLIDAHDNLIVFRTLSKAFALAGIRCGFTLAQSDVIAMMSKVIAPYPVPRPIAQIASQALNQDGLGIMRARVSTLNQLRSVFLEQAKALSIVTQAFPATGNYVLLRFNDSARVFTTLGKQGIVLRDFSNKPRLENCIRVTIGNAHEMQVTLDALKGLCD